MIPPFGDDGLLPPGVHWATWEELRARFGTTPHRRRLLAGLRAALESLASVGCKSAYIDGSFVTAKNIPGDFDACWDIDGVDFALLETRDRVLLTFENRRAAQKAKYRGELFPAQVRAETSPPYRIFLEFFQIDKDTGNPKGIVAIDLQGWQP